VVRLRVTVTTVVVTKVVVTKVVITGIQSLAATGHSGIHLICGGAIPAMPEEKVAILLEVPGGEPIHHLIKEAQIAETQA